MQEIWIAIEGYESHYEISNMGSVRNKNGLILSQQELNSGYMAVRLKTKQRNGNYTVHRLIAKHFISNPDNKEQVNHIDGDKTHNVSENLEWVSPTENCTHAWNTGIMENSRVKASERMSEVGKKYSVANSNRLKTYPRDEKGHIMKPINLN